MAFLSPLIIAIALLSEMFLGDIDLGPFSLRVYVISGLFAAALFGQLLGGRRLVGDVRATVLILVYVIFVAWTVVASMVHGLPVESILRKTASRDLLALMAFVSITFFLRTRDQVLLLAKLLVFGVVISAVIAVFQWRGFAWSWDLWSLLRPKLHEDLLGAEYSGLTPGIFAHSFTFGYYLASVGFLSLTLFLMKRRPWRLLNLLAIITGVLVVQQRSALLAWLILFMIVLAASRRFSTWTLIAIAFTALTVFAVTSYVLAEGQREDVDATYELSRFKEAIDLRRLDLVVHSLRFAGENPGVGGVRKFISYLEARQDLYDHHTVTAPHNYFLNAVVFYGFPGLLLAVLLLLLTLEFMRALWRRGRDSGDWLALGLVLALLGYLINAQFHNASFVTGDTLPWWLLGMMTVLHRQYLHAGRRQAVRKQEDNGRMSSHGIALPPSPHEQMT
jgi:hypothetical protein